MIQLQGKWLNVIERHFQFEYILQNHTGIDRFAEYMKEKKNNCVDINKAVTMAVTLSGSTIFISIDWSGILSNCNWSMYPVGIFLSCSIFGWTSHSVRYVTNGWHCMRNHIIRKNYSIYKRSIIAKQFSHFDKIRVNSGIFFLFCCRCRCRSRHFCAFKSIFLYNRAPQKQKE